MSINQPKSTEKASENPEGKGTVVALFSATATARECADLLAKVGGGRPGKVTTCLAADRVSEFLESPISPGRIYDIWRGEALPKAHEMDAIRAAAGIIQEVRDEFAAMDTRIARLEALLVQDEDFYGEVVAHQRQNRRSTDRALG